MSLVERRGRAPIQIRYFAPLKTVNSIINSPKSQRQFQAPVVHLAEVAKQQEDYVLVQSPTSRNAVPAACVDHYVVFPGQRTPVLLGIDQL